MDKVHFTPTDTQIEAIMEATTDAEIGGGLMLLWEMMIGMPLTQYNGKPIKASSYCIPKEDHTEIFDRSIKKLSKINRVPFAMLWMDIGPSAIEEIEAS